jgi:hypothetical protein
MVPLLLPLASLPSSLESLSLGNVMLELPEGLLGQEEEAGSPGGASGGHRPWGSFGSSGAGRWGSPGGSSPGGSGHWGSPGGVNGPGHWASPGSGQWGSPGRGWERRGLAAPVQRQPDGARRGTPPPALAASPPLLLPLQAGLLTRSGVSSRMASSAAATAAAPTPAELPLQRGAQGAILLGPPVAAHVPMPLLQPAATLASQLLSRHSPPTGAILLPAPPSSNVPIPAAAVAAASMVPADTASSAAAAAAGSPGSLQARPGHRRRGRGAPRWRTQPMARLRDLDLHGCHIAEELLPLLVATGSLAALTALRLAGVSGLHDAALAALAPLTGLESLQVRC